MDRASPVNQGEINSLRLIRLYTRKIQFLLLTEVFKHLLMQFEFLVTLFVCDFQPGLPGGYH